jgi:transcriptional regulator with GAF, ATPase, and Fis domain
MTLTQTESAPIGRIATGGLHRRLVVYSSNITEVGDARSLTEHALAIGRDPETRPCLSLRHARVSRTHAVVEPSAGGSWAIRDLQSRNGTFVNGRRIEQTALRDGDVIRVGSSLILFQFLDVAACSLVLGADVPHSSTLVGPGHAMARVRQAIRAAPTGAPTLIQGETGVGKELVAQAIHEHSGREGPFVPINCAALPANLAESELFGHVRGAFTGADARRGLFGRADKGTLFLDEIGEISSEVQAKLLRALALGEIRPVGSDQPRFVDVRIVAATNVDLEGAVASGAFRADLYARLMSHIVVVPPLRQRKEDILPLARHFLRGGARVQISPDAAEALLTYEWPYNVRELEQMLASLSPAVVEHGTLELEDLPARMRTHVEARFEPVPPSELLEISLLDLKRGGSPNAEELRAVVKAHEGNIARVASFFGKDRRQIYRWAETLGVDIQALRSPQPRPGETIPPGFESPE